MGIPYPMIQAQYYLLLFFYLMGIPYPMIQAQYYLLLFFYLMGIPYPILLFVTFIKG